MSSGAFRKFSAEETSGVFGIFKTAPMYACEGAMVGMGGLSLERGKPPCRKESLQSSSWGENGLGYGDCREVEI